MISFFAPCSRRRSFIFVCAGLDNLYVTLKTDERVSYTSNSALLAFWLAVMYVAVMYGIYGCTHCASPVSASVVTAAVFPAAERRSHKACR